MLNIYNINEEGKPVKAVTYFDYYTLKNASTLFEVAKEKNVNPDLLSVLNGLEVNDYLEENQVLMIPRKDYSYYITQAGDTLETVKTTFNTSLNSILNTNAIIYLQAGQLIVNKTRQ